MNVEEALRSAGSLAGAAELLGVDRRRLGEKVRKDRDLRAILDDVNGTAKREKLRAGAADALRAAGGDVAAAARTLGVDRRVLREIVREDPDLSAIRAAGGKPEKVRVERTAEGGAEVTIAWSDPATVLSPERLLAKVGLDPAEVTIEKHVANTWGKASDPNYQLKLWTRPRVAFEKLIGQAVHVPRVKRAKRAARRKGTPERIVVMGDHQAPYHDVALHSAALGLLRDLAPDRGVYLGDLMDLPSISRHPDNPVFDASPQECVQAGYAILRDVVEASGGVPWDFLDSNHDARLRSELLQRAERLYGLRPAEVEPGLIEDPSLHLSRLLHFEQLGVTGIFAEQGYEHSEAKLAPGLVVRHGFLTGKDVGAKMVEKLGVSALVGHTHGREHFYTVQYGEGDPVIRQGVVIGGMCRDDLHFVVNPKWVRGFVVVELWDDGLFTVDHAIWHPTAGALLFRGSRYDPS